MKETIKKIVNLIKENPNGDFINSYPFFALIDDKGFLKEKILIDNKYTYYFDTEERYLYVENNLTGKNRKINII